MKFGCDFRTEQLIGCDFRTEHLISMRPGEHVLLLWKVLIAISVNL